MARIDQYKRQIDRLGREYGVPRLSRALNGLLDSNVEALREDKQELQRALGRGPAGMRQYLRTNSNFFKGVIKKMYDVGKLAYGEIADLDSEVERLGAENGTLRADVARMRPIVRRVPSLERKADRLDSIEDAVRNYRVAPTPQPRQSDINYLRNL